MMAHAGRDSKVSLPSMTFSEFIKQMAENVLYGIREPVMPLSKLTTVIRNDPNCKYLQLKPASLCKILQDFPDTFNLQGPQGNPNVSLHSGIGICDNVKNCLGYPQCKDLHICKYFVYDNCAHTRRHSRTSCKYPHSFGTSHNKKVLQYHHLLHVDQETIKMLARGSTPEPVSAPAPHLKLCFYYTRRVCNRDRCSYLHLCEFFVKGSCKFGRRCKKNHDVFSRDIIAILRENHIDTNGDDRYILESIRAEIYGDEEEEEEDVGEENDVGEHDETEEDEDEEEENVNSLPENPNVNGPIPKRSYTNFRKRDRH